MGTANSGHPQLASVEEKNSKLRLGASYWLVEAEQSLEDDTLTALELFGGVGYDSNAVPDATLEPVLLGFHDVAVNAGAKFTFGGGSDGV